MPVALPHTFHDNVQEAASGVQVMENLEALLKAINEQAAVQQRLDSYWGRVGPGHSGAQIFRRGIVGSIGILEPKAEEWETENNEIAWTDWAAVDFPARAGFTRKLIVTGIVLSNTVISGVEITFYLAYLFSLAGAAGMIKTVWKPETGAGALVTPSVTNSVRTEAAYTIASTRPYTVIYKLSKEPAANSEMLVQATLSMRYE
jgi:hypothetical protein